MATPRFRFTGTVLNTRDPGALAAFYQRLLGWPELMNEPGWVVIRESDNGTALAFQLDDQYVAPTWPAANEEHRVTVHLDFTTDDLEAAVAHAVAAGASMADTQPSDVERVMLDPDGHPFCLIPASEW